MIRPEVSAALWRWREVIATLGLGAVGMALMLGGGWVRLALGGALAVLAAALAINAVRRMRFGQGGGGPGIVEVDEARISYFGPQGGGFVSVVELSELRLVTLAGRRHWRLKQMDGQALLIPVEASGAERLFDAFASLPGIAGSDLVAALQAADVQALGPVIWRHPALPALT